MNGYISIDIETTGLDPDTCQILEIAAVLHEPGLPVMTCPTFERVVLHDVIYGSPFALQMNAELIRKIANGEATPLRDSMADFVDWVSNCRNRLGVDKFHALGKNFASFDLPFLKRVEGWCNCYFHYRCLEVGSMYSTPDGVPGMAGVCEKTAERHKIPGQLHSALYDARVTLAMARDFWHSQGLYDWLV